MSKRLLTQGTETAQTDSSARERRRNRRVRVSLQLRIRPLDFVDGTVEEVRTTLNASRNALYFFSTLDRYYKGMRLRIASPYGPFAGSSHWDDTGEVVRVHRRGGGFGVAVVLYSPATTRLAAPDVPVQDPLSQPTRRDDRRCYLRSPFIAPAELIDTRSSVRIQARTSDLSVNGCYIDTLNPFPVGTSVRLRIYKGNALLDACASVISQHPGSGMGLVFREVTPAQGATLETWLCDSLVLAELPPLPAVRPEKTAQPTGPEESRSARLIQVLVRKGFLTHSEATEVLCDPDR